MSYILDALRRADSERERGAVPGIHTQPFRPGADDALRPSSARAWIWALAACGVAVLLSVLAWRWLQPDVPRLAAAPAVLAPAPIPVTAAPPTVVAAAPAASVATPVPAPVQPAAAVVPPAKPKAAPKPRAPAAAALAASGVARPSAQPDKSASASAAEGRIYAQSELPDDIRRQLPALAVGGSMYSQNAANRILIIHGQVFHEGDKLGPDLTLEQIKLKAAVLNFKGYRYSISY